MSEHELDGGRFVEVVSRPQVTVAQRSQTMRARSTNLPRNAASSPLGSGSRYGTNLRSRAASDLTERRSDRVSVERSAEG
jgi:hypothetical protein